MKRTVDLIKLAKVIALPTPEYEKAVYGLLASWRLDDAEELLRQFRELTDALKARTGDVLSITAAFDSIDQASG